MLKNDAGVDKNVVIKYYSATDANVFIATGTKQANGKQQTAPLFEVHPDGLGLVKSEQGRDISTKHEHIFVTKSEVQKMLPPHPTADGDYKLHIAAGVATWVTV